jgi:hypothetical protein
VKDYLRDYAMDYAFDLPEELVYWSLIRAWARYTHNHPTVEASTVTVFDVLPEWDNGILGY